MRTVRPLLLAAALAAITTPAAAQDAGDVAAYFALSLTPVGALPPNPIGADVAAAPRRFDVLYGRVDFGFGSLDNFAFAYSEQSGRGRVGVRAGVVTGEGEEVVMAGIEYESVLTSTRRADGSVVSVGLLPAAGVSRPLDGDADALFLSASLGLPLVYSAGDEWRVSFFLVPGAGWGRASGGSASEQGIRPMVGGGLRVSARSGSGVVVGAQKIIIDNGEATIGVGITVAMGGARSAAAR